MLKLFTRKSKKASKPAKPLEPLAATGTRKHKKQLRHKAEIKLVRFGGLVTLIGVPFAGWVFVDGFKDFGSTFNDPYQLLALGIFFAPLIMLVYAYRDFWATVADSIEITDSQHPEVHQIFLEAAADIGLKQVPRLFLANGNGIMNAFAAKRSLHKNYIVIFSDLLDVYNELDAEHRDVLRFVLAHELGHVYLGHVNIRRNVIQSVLRLALLEASFVRAQEYSADRVAASVATSNNRAASMFPLYAGKRQFKHLSIEHYIDHDTKEVNRFWVGLANFQSDHPVGRRRLAALDRMDKEGWRKVHGKML